MKKKRTAQPVRHSLGEGGSAACGHSLGEGGFLNVRAVIILLVCAAACLFVAETPAKGSQRMLTFADRVAYQRAIEEVYWRHRIWPKESAKAKPSLDAVMSQSQLEKKVADYLRKSEALEDYWQRPITAEQLQAEMDRMAQHTKQPEVLRELFEALGNDPFVIAECLGRPVLSERLFKSAMASQDVTSAVGQPINSRRIDRARFSGYTLPRIANASKQEGTCLDNWTPTSLTNAPDARANHTAVWTGNEMIVWGGASNGPIYFNTGGRYNPSTDSWTATSTANAPDARAVHTAVWTGSEMIVWGGGTGGSTFFNTGGRYNPSADSWTATTLTGAPSARTQQTAVWTGSQMIVWGGGGSSGYFDTGGRYDPISDSWTATSTIGAPSPRALPKSVWTGSEMIVWGGGAAPLLNTGGRYNPGTDSWTATSTTGAPAGRFFPSALWTGSEMIVWGGENGSGFQNTGGRYNPSTDSWTATSTTNAPAAREAHKAVWTGSEMTGAPAGREFHTAVWTASQMIVWGGAGNGSYLNTGGRYCAAAASPTPTPTPCTGAWTEQSPYPIAVSGNAVASQGGNVYSFGGIANNTAIANAYKYNPDTNTWTPIAFLPESRYWFSATSDGTYIYLLGGVNENGLPRATLWRYDPTSNTYNTSLPSYTIATYFHASAYLNGKIYRIAGRGMGTDFHVEVYDITTNSWSMAANFPGADQMLMAAALGGYIYAGGGNTVGCYRYDPVANVWTPIASLPAIRSLAASDIYNGRWVLAGGDVTFVPSNSVIAWDPSTNTWNTLPNMVQARDLLAGATAGLSFYAVAGNSGPGTPTNDTQQYTEVPCGTPTPTATASPTATPTSTPTPTCVPGGTKIYNIAGFTLGVLTNTTRIYDISSNTWTTGAQLPTMLAAHATAYYNGKIYVAGGYGDTGVTNALYIYDIATNTWTTGASMPQALDLPGFGVINGKVYVAAGNNGSVELNTLYMYDIASNTWTQRANVPTPVTGPGSAVYQGHLYLFGGGFPTPHAVTQVYDPVTNSWTTCGNLNVARLWFYGGNVDNNGFVAPGGDESPGVPSNVNEQGGCMWAVRAPLPYPARGPFAVSDGTYVYIGGGYDGITVHADLLRYDPVANTYTLLASSPDSHYFSQAVLVPGGPCGTPTPTATATATATHTPTGTPTFTPTPTATPTTTPTLTPRPSPTPRLRPTPPPRP